MSTQRFQKKASGVILNMDYGLGKTLTSLAHAEMCGWNLLLLCPPCVMQHLLREIDKHFCGISFLEAKKWEPRTFMKYKIIVMSFYTLARLSEKEMQQEPYIFKTCIVDELEDAIQKTNTKRKIQNFIQARFTIGLTGAFTINAQMLKLVKTTTSKNIFVFRQPAQFVHHTCFVTLTEEQHKTYVEKKTRLEHVNNGFEKLRIFNSLREQLGFAKVDIVSSLLTQTQNMKVLVVSEFVSVLERIGMNVRKAKKNYVCFAPKYFPTQEKRSKALNAFEKDPSFNIMLADLDIIVFGQDCGFVDVLITVDLPRDVHLERQLNGRLRRIGQHASKLSVQHVFNIIVKDTADEVLYKDIHNK